MTISKLFKTRDGRDIYYLRKYIHPIKFKIKNRNLKNCIYQGEVFNNFSGQLQTAYWNKDGEYCNRERPDYDLIPIIKVKKKVTPAKFPIISIDHRLHFNDRINQLIKEGKVKYYSSFKLFKNRKNEKNN